jgi:hypothetical protein
LSVYLNDRIHRKMTDISAKPLSVYLNDRIHRKMTDISANNNKKMGSHTDVVTIRF